MQCQDFAVRGPGAGDGITSVRTALFEGVSDAVRCFVGIGRAWKMDMALKQQVAGLDDAG